MKTLKDVTREFDEIFDGFVEYEFVTETSVIKARDFIATALKEFAEEMRLEPAPKSDKEIPGGLTEAYRLGFNMALAFQNKKVKEYFGEVKDV